MPLFTLGKRLSICASMVRQNTKLADIGTDHAYLPIWLSKMGFISKAVAADIKSGPLEKAEQNIKKYHVQNIVEARLSNGLKEISPNEADDIVIAGMGGEMIIKIIDEAKWLKDKYKRLILQPMTCVTELRRYLAEKGFLILEERAVIDDNHAYTVILAEYNFPSIITDKLYEYMGKLNPKIEDSKEYLRHVINQLVKKARGLEISGEKEKASELYVIINGIKSKIEE